MGGRALTRPGSLRAAKAWGYRVAPNLPEQRALAGLRPPLEIASRLMALDAVYSWVAMPEEDAPSERLRGYADRNGLAAWMTKEEWRLFALRRTAVDRHRDAVGWRLENMWPLAWALGFEPAPPVDGAMIVDKTIRGIILEFLPGLDARPADIATKPRPAEEVAALEDLFYCVHNAVRSAQLGEKTVPDGFHPIVHGGVIHERRHALTWCLSVGTSWEDVDLAT